MSCYITHMTANKTPLTKSEIIKKQITLGELMDAVWKTQISLENNEDFYDENSETSKEYALLFDVHGVLQTRWDDLEKMI